MKKVIITLLFCSLTMIASIYISGCGQQQVVLPRTIQVSPGSSIQTAINSANNGDTIEILPGTYTEKIDLKGKIITLRSSVPTDSSVVAATIIDGGGSGPVITFDSSTTVSSLRKFSDESETNLGPRFEGLTVRNGNASRGGGIFVKGADLPIFDSMVIHDNGGTEYGGGLFLYDCNGAYIVDSIFRNNLCRGNGGGVAQLDSTNTIISDSTFETNVSSGQGGGFFHTSENKVLPANGSWFDMTKCTFRDNHSGGDGGGSYSTVSNISYSECTFQDNTAGIPYTFISVINTGTASHTVTVTFYTKGGGTALVETSSTVGSGTTWNLNIDKCTFSSNQTNGYGGGIGFYPISDPSSNTHNVTLIDNTITGNTSTSGVGGGLFIGSGWVFTDINGTPIPILNLESLNTFSNNSPDNVSQQQ